MEQVLKKPLWKNIVEAQNRSWSRSIRRRLMLAISSSLLAALLAVGLVIYTFTQGEENQTSALAFAAGGILLIWLISSFLINAILNHMLLRRIENLQNDAARIASGDLQYRIPIEQLDELGIINENINEIAKRLAEREALLVKARNKALLDSLFKSELLARVNHNLRQPLSVILGYSEIIRDEIFGPANNLQRKAADEIIISTGRLSQMVTDLIEASRLESQGLHMRIDDFSPGLLLRQISAQIGPVAEIRELAFSTELDPRLPENLRGDANRLLQILYHLADNAIKFTRRGSVYIRAFHVDADHWALSVADTGPGIPGDALGYIFEPFRQVNDLATIDRGGIGLGLAIVQQLVILMGGCIRVESTVGVGSTFLVTLPLDPNLQRGV